MNRYNWTIVLPAELSAASVLIGFWNKDINPAAWVAMCMVVVIVINLLGAGKITSVIIGGSAYLCVLLGAYGEAEFVFA